MAEVHEEDHAKKRKWPVSDDLAQVKEPRHSEKISDETCSLYCSARLKKICNISIEAANRLHRMPTQPTKNKSIFFSSDIRLVFFS